MTQCDALHWTGQGGQCDPWPASLAWLVSHLWDLFLVLLGGWGFVSHRVLQGVYTSFVDGRQCPAHHSGTGADTTTGMTLYLSRAELSCAVALLGVFVLGFCMLACPVAGQSTRQLSNFGN